MIATPNSQEITVKDYWKPHNDITAIWKNWDTHPRRSLILNQINTNPLITELSTRRIRVQEGPNILRWGHRLIGAFTLKESYTLHVGHNAQNDQELWQWI